MKILIRKAKVKDMKYLLSMSIDLLTYHESLWKDDKSMRKYLHRSKGYKKAWGKWILKGIKSPEWLVLVAEAEGGEIVGYSSSFIKKNVPIFNLKKLGVLGDFYIVPKYRSKGISSRFKNETFEWFKKKSVGHVSIFLNKPNKKAHEIYSKWGFKDYSIEMRKKL